MQVTLGDEGSPSSAAVAAAEDERPRLPLRDTNMGLDRAAEAERPRLRLPLALRESRPGGAGSFSLPGLDETMTPPGFIIPGETSSEGSSRASCRPTGLGKAAMGWWRVACTSFKVSAC